MNKTMNMREGEGAGAVEMESAREIERKIKYVPTYIKRTEEKKIHTEKENDGYCIKATVSVERAASRWL